MKFILKNTQMEVLQIYIEPSTDEILLGKDDELTIVSRFEYGEAFEFHYRFQSISIWVPHGQSADFYINGKEIQTICSQYVW